MSNGMFEASRQADWLVPPTNGSVATNEDRARVVACTTTDQAVDLAAIASNYAYITLQADGDDLYFVFDSQNAADPSLSPSATTGAAQCVKLPKDTSQDYKLDKQAHRFLWVRSSTTNAFLRFWQSSQRRASV